MDRRVYGGCSNDELAEAICQVHSLISASQAELMQMIAVFGERKAYEADGARSMASWLEGRLSLSTSTARDLARTAGFLTELPTLAGLLASGQVSFDQLRPVAAVVKPEQEDDVAKVLPGLSAAQAEELARAARRRSAADENGEHQTRSLRMGRKGTMCAISGRLTQSDGDIVRKALLRLVETYPKDPETGLFEALEARMADALVDICSAGIRDDEDADLATVVVHVGPEIVSGADGHAMSEAGTHISAEAARRLLCDCRLQVVREDEHGHPLAFSTTTHAIPTSIYRQLRRRDRTCRFPGCHATRLVNGHHIVFWGMGGPTEMGNLCLLCRRHHRMIHHEGWRMVGEPGGHLDFVSPTGQILSSLPMPLLDEVEKRFFGWRHGPPDGPPDEGHSAPDPPEFDFELLSEQRRWGQVWEPSRWGDGT